MNEIISLLQNHRSIRKFTNEPVSRNSEKLFYSRASGIYIQQYASV